jgi:tetratricopeptide (TPR) repeat protein
VGQLAMAGLRRLAGKSANTTWGGMQMFLQNQIPPNDPRRETVYRNFEHNLRDILHAGLDSGAKVILNTMSVNLKDCPPFASLTNSNLPSADREQFQKVYQEGLALEKAGSAAEAAHQFEQAAKLDPAFAELQYRWAECLWRSTHNTARMNYQLACDTDALPFRADTRINTAIRRVAGELGGSSLILSDAESILADASPNGIAGDEVFFEHVHFNFRGNYLLGRLWAEQIMRLLPGTTTAASSVDWASEEVCELDLGLTPWNRSFVIESVIRRMQQPPLSSQFNNPALLAALQAELKSLQALQADTNAVMRSGQELVDAIQRAPRDPFLYDGLANLYEALGDRKRAADAYRKTLELLPYDFYSKLQLGRLYGELGQPAEGEPLLQQAARQRPTIPEVWTELGKVQMTQKKYAVALESYTQAIKLRPQDAASICCQANALSMLNRPLEAIALYQRAIQIQPDLSQAHFELAGLYAADNRMAEASSEYTEAIRLDPRHAVSRINLGVVLFRQDRLDEAIQQFEAALQIEPQNSAAADYLRQVSEKRKERR